MKTKHHLLTNTLTHSLTHMHAHTGSSQPCLHCTKERSSIFFQASFSSSRGPSRLSTSYSHPPLPSLSLSPFLFSGFKGIAYLKYYSRKDVPSVSALSRLSSKDKVFLGVAEPSLWRLSLQHFICNSTIYRRTFTYSTVCLLQLVHICLGDYVHAWGGEEGGYCGSMRWISILFTSLFTTNSAKLLRTTVRLKFTTTGRRAVSLRWQKPPQSAAVWSDTAIVATGGIILHILVLGGDQTWSIFNVE